MIDVNQAMKILNDTNKAIDSFKASAPNGAPSSSKQSLSELFAKGQEALTSLGQIAPDQAARLVQTTKSLAEKISQSRASLEAANISTASFLAALRDAQKNLNSASSKDDRLGRKVSGVEHEKL